MYVQACTSICNYFCIEIFLLLISLPPLSLSPPFSLLLPLSLSLPLPPIGESLLPIPKAPTEPWRMIHFKYKKHKVMTHVVDGYDVTVQVPKTVSPYTPAN